MIFFTVAQRLDTEPVQSHEYNVTDGYAPPSRLLDELRTPLWWTPEGVTLTR